MASRRIAYLVSTDKPESELRRREAIIGDIMTTDANLDILEANSPLTSIESREDEQIVIPYLGELLQRVEDQYEVFVISCLGDVGCHELRKITSKPVIAPARATILLGVALMDRLAVVTINEEEVQLFSEIVRKCGVGEKIGDILSLEFSPTEIVEHPDEAFNKLTEELDKLGAEGMIPACASMAFLCAEKGADLISGVRVFNPLTTSIKMAEALVV